MGISRYISQHTPTPYQDKTSFYDKVVKEHHSGIQYPKMDKKFSAINNHHFIGEAALDITGTLLPKLSIYQYINAWNFNTRYI